MNCVTCDDCNEPKITYKYLNKTEFSVTLESKSKNGTSIKPSGQIPPNEELAITGGGEFLQAFEFTSDSTIEINISFNSDPKKCLQFDGPILNEDYDPRSKQAYTINRDYIYTITDSTYIKAIDCLN